MENKMGRNRKEGWKYAKESGHLNEELLSTIDFVPSEICGLLKNNETVLEIKLNGGKSQHKEMSVLGHKTTPKIDNIIKTNLRSFKTSLKKSPSGQVLLTSSDNFFKTLEIMFNVSVDDEVKSTMKLFTGEDYEGVKEALKSSEVRNVNQKCSRSQRNRRLNIEALLVYSPNQVTKLLKFFTDNIKEITTMVFSTGSVENKDFHAEFLYYKNIVNPSKSMDDIFHIDDIVNNVIGKPINFGEKYGGTTIVLPFGHLQMHKNILQIHHSYEKINKLVQG